MTIPRGVLIPETGQREHGGQSRERQGPPFPLLYPGAAGLSLARISHRRGAYGYADSRPRIRGRETPGRRDPASYRWLLGLTT